MNCPNSLIINKALAEKKGILKFYVSTCYGDSSIIKPSYYEETIKVETISLTEIIKDKSIRKVKLLKVEAEGYEPEVLKGCMNSLHLIEYICIDGGYERGVQKEQTFTDIINFLLKKNFEIVDINFKWQRGLFHNNLFKISLFSFALFFDF